MKSLFKADIAEKLLLNDQELIDEDCFKIGGKVLFSDLSSLKYINNLVFLEKTIPNFESFEYKEFNSNNKNSDSLKLLKEMVSLNEGKFLEKALIVTPNPQDRAEGDYEFIVFFKNGESAVKNFSNTSYSFYNKNETDKIMSNFGLDTYLVHKKLERDFELNNKLNLKIKYKA